MSVDTYTAFHLQTSNIDRVIRGCQAWLETSFRGQVLRYEIVVEEGRKFPSRRFAKFLDDTPPVWFVIGQSRSGWVTVHYNSFFKIEKPVAELSGQLGCLGAVVLAQTVNDYYYISVYRKGEKIRTLEFVKGDGWLKQEGTPLPFEKETLGEDNSKAGQEPFYFFGAQEAETYCKNLGFSILGEEVYEPKWESLLMQRDDPNIRDENLGLGPCAFCGQKPITDRISRVRCKSCNRVVCWRCADCGVFGSLSDFQSFVKYAFDDVVYLLAENCPGCQEMPWMEKYGSKRE